VIGTIGDLARDKLADRVEDDTAPLLGTPAEVIAACANSKPEAPRTSCWSIQCERRQPPRLRPRSHARVCACTGGRVKKPLPLK